MIKWIRIVLFFIPGLFILAQGSSYTRLGIGDIINSGNARQTGLGGLAIGSTDRFSIGDINPAGWNGINLTRFQLSLSYLGKSIEDSKSTAKYSEANFEGFSMAVPLYRDLGVVASLGIVPVTRVSYNVNSIQTDPTFGEITREYKGSGGLSKMYAGSSFRFPFGLSVGAQFEYYFGKIDYQSSLLLPDTVHFNTVLYTSKRSYSGLGATFGILSPDINNLLKIEGLSDFRLGAFITLTNKINTDTSLISNTSSGISEFSHGLTKTNLPLKYGFGISAKIKDEYLLVADFVAQNWSAYTLTDAKDPYLTEYYRISGGVEYLAEESEFSNIWEQIKYRAGLSYEQSQYQIANKNVNQYALYGGFSFPLGVANSIDVAFTFGYRGKKNNQLLYEKFFGTSVSLSFGELWFVRRRR